MIQPLLPTLMKELQAMRRVGAPRGDSITCRSSGGGGFVLNLAVGRLCRHADPQKRPP
jgi:hypothetical protein